MTGSGAGSLAAAVEAGLTGYAVPRLSAGARRLMAAYRSGEVPAAPVMASAADVAAYAAYRMPATVAATCAALRELRRSVPGWAPGSVVDFGAGTGGAGWAVAAELPTVVSMTLLEQSAEAIRLGKAILGAAELDALRTATWRSWRLAPDGSSAMPPGADLATAAYLLGELSPAGQSAIVALAASAAPVVVLVEPGTPAGHRRILAAREQLVAAGYAVAAPCPHELACPLDVDGDWCHFGARLQRSAVHRKAKSAELSYEDEKFSYVAAIRSDGIEKAPPLGRIVRRPQQRKGLVRLDLCWHDGTTRRDLVSKSKGETYSQARKVAWGEGWPPAESDGKRRDMES